MSPHWLNIMAGSFVKHIIADATWPFMQGYDQSQEFGPFIVDIIPQNPLPGALADRCILYLLQAI